MELDIGCFYWSLIGQCAACLVVKFNMCPVHCLAGSWPSLTQEVLLRVGKGPSKHEDAGGTIWLTPKGTAD